VSVLLVVAAALAWSAPAPGAIAPQELTVAASDGARLACALYEPDGTPPTAGWPAVMLFHGLGGTRRDLQPLAVQLAPAGYAALACDARGHGTSEGFFGLDGPRDVQDTRELFTWLATRPEISDTQIGAMGFSLGGGAVWNAAVAGVPFKAIVPAIAWTNLGAALAPQGFSKSGLVGYLANLVPESRWDPELLAAKPSLATGTNMATVNALAASRSPISKLGALKTPTLIVQGRRDFLFDIDQALAAYKALTGPKRLYLGNLGHAPGRSLDASPDAAQVTALALKWFDRFLKGTANGVDKKVVELGHDPYDGKTTTFTTAPPTKTIAVTLPGTTTITGTAGKVVRGARVTGGPHETFGTSTVTVRYSDANGWDRLVAVLAVGTTPVSAGGAKITAPSGTVTIKLMDQALRVAAGQRLVVYLSSTSTAQDPGNALYLAGVQPASQITIGRSTLTLSVLQKAVSRVK
jgi:alpha-beta hydrolase superfamily lysophospholipase